MSRKSTHNWKQTGVWFLLEVIDVSLFHEYLNCGAESHKLIFQPSSLILITFISVSEICLKGRRAWCAKLQVESNLTRLSPFRLFQLWRYMVIDSSLDESMRRLVFNWMSETFPVLCKIRWIWAAWSSFHSHPTLNLFQPCLYRRQIML